MRRLPLLCALLLASTALAGGAGGPRTLVPNFAAAGPWAVDCDAATRRDDGCRLREALPAGTSLPAPGQFRVLPGKDRLTVLYHAPTAAVREVALCCGLQLPLAPIPGTRLWAVTARVQNVQQAALTLEIVSGSQRSATQEPTLWRGPEAPAPVLRASRLAGQVRRVTLDSGDALTGSRTVTVYTPPGWTRAEALPAVYLADGGSAEELARTLEPAVEAGTAPRVVLVGIQNAPSFAPGSTTYRPEDDRRAHEYLEGQAGGAERFTAHERFVLKVVLPWAEREYGLRAAPDARAVGGFSNGGAWAISLAARHPDTFRGVIALSPSNAAVQNAPHPRARVSTQGGTLEPSFLRAATQYAALARKAGAATRLVTRVGGHDLLLWAEAFPGAVAFTLGR